MTHNAEKDAPTYTREDMARAWDAALSHVWELADPAWTIVITQASKYLVTEADIVQAKRENPYVLPPGQTGEEQPR